METFTAASLRGKQIEPPPLLSANLPMGPSHSPEGRGVGGEQKEGLSSL